MALDHGIGVRIPASQPLAQRLLAAVLAVAAVGCDARCLVESRAVDSRAETRIDSRVGTAALELSETRGAEAGAFVLWHVRVSPAAGRAATVVLRQGTPDAPGRVLYRFPLVNAVPESGVLTQVFVRTPYAGEVPFAELWDLVQREPVSFEVALEGDAGTLRVGPLLPGAAGDWREACT